VRLVLAVVAVLVLTAVAWADHGGPMRAAGWSPMTAALVFGGLALLAGMLVVVIVALLSRRDRPSS
jgi:ABC-type phosphate transport system permease subunit